MSGRLCIHRRKSHHSRADCGREKPESGSRSKNFYLTAERVRSPQHPSSRTELSAGTGFVSRLSFQASSSLCHLRNAQLNGYCFSVRVGHPWPGPAPSLDLLTPKQHPSSRAKLIAGTGFVSRLSFLVSRLSSLVSRLSSLVSRQEYLLWINAAASEYILRVL
jgi:hypothetical protein